MMWTDVYYALIVFVLLLRFGCHIILGFSNNNNLLSTIIVAQWRVEVTNGWSR